MYTATIHTVSIVSPGVTIEEEHIARETLNRWNAENGTEKGKVFLPLPSDSTAETDIYVLPIDNYVDITNANTIIATSKLSSESSAAKRYSPMPDKLASGCEPKPRELTVNKLTF